jgi:hypothetical protein
MEQLRVVWNTGRLYTEQGQIIAASLLDDGSVRFVDRSRMIDGVIERADLRYEPWDDAKENERALCAAVLDAYDFGRFRTWIERYQDWSEESLYDALQALARGEENKPKR